MTSATAGGPYKVPQDDQGWRSLTLATAMHAVLVLFLWVGIHWQNNAPVAVEAEVWDMQVQSAAPPAPPAPPAPEEQPEPEPVKPPPPAPPVEAPPVPKEPDIALERQKAKQKAEQEKQDALKLARLEEKKLADKKLAEQKLKDEKLKAEKLKAEKLKDEKDRLDKEKKELANKKAQADKLDKAAETARAAEMSRITGAVGNGSNGTAARAAGPRSDGSYEAAIRSKIKSNLVYATSDDTLSATFKITQLPNGEVIGIRKTKSSGSAAYDSAIENAITKSSPLPKKKDGTVEREFDAVFNMKDLH